MQSVTGSIRIRTIHNMVKINGQDVSKLDEARAGHIFMQAEEPISVKVKRRGSNTPSDTQANSQQTNSHLNACNNDSSASEQHSENDLLSPLDPTTEANFPPKNVCTECQKRFVANKKSVSIQTEDGQFEEGGVVVSGGGSGAEIWIRDASVLQGHKQSNYGDVGYKDLMSHEDVYGTLDELDELELADEEAIYEDLYNHIMPLPAPFNLVEYEDVIIPKTGNKLGMTLCHGNDDIFGVFISALEPNGVAARTGSLQIGDQILQINESLIETKEQALVLFNSVKTADIKVTVARSKQQMYEEILFTDDPSSPVSCSLFPIMEAKSSDNNNSRNASSACPSPRVPNSPSGQHLHKILHPQNNNITNAPSPTPPEVPERYPSPTKGLVSNKNESSTAVTKPQNKTDSSHIDKLNSAVNEYPEISRITKPQKEDICTQVGSKETQQGSSPVKKLGAGKLQPQTRNMGLGDVPVQSCRRSQSKQNLLVSTERFDSSGYCSSNLNSPKMLSKLSHSPSIASSIAQHGKQYRSYLKLIKLKDEDSVYGVPMGLMPDIKDENSRSPKNRDSIVTSHSRHRRSASQIRQRAQKIKEETLILTTDDETLSELKMGKFWTKQERKRQFLVAKEHKQRRYMMERSRALYRDIQNAKKLGSNGSGSGNDGNTGNDKVFSTMSKKELKEKKEKILDNFWTIQELLAHGGRMSDGSLHPLLSVTTV
ncbi:PDZ domain-containing RING finger protein 4-like isoform X2 [Symsagittifera roscoffensis]|uniref:PDZ domain-containing RING finger protein 4-like isoform X2 n=1 Tax=Symsagittifera roscoffensis TaxID=84072 RepID=UPI00307C974E